MSHTKPTSPDIDDRELDEILLKLIPVKKGRANLHVGGVYKIDVSDVNSFKRFELKNRLLSWKNEQVREELEKCRDTGYAPELETYDYDRIAEAVFERLAQLATPNQTNEREV